MHYMHFNPYLAEERNQQIFREVNALRLEKRLGDDRVSSGSRIFALARMMKSATPSRIILLFAAALAALLVVSAMTLSPGQVRKAHALGPNAIRAGFDANELLANDDESTEQVPLGFGNPVDFLGAQYSNLYVNNNGNVTFDAPLPEYTPSSLEALDKVIIAPFWADVDTRATNTAKYAFGQGSVDGRDAFGATWQGVGYYERGSDKLNDFQLVIIDRSDTGAGNFDIEFNYDRIEWESGDASGGSGGLGGSSARAGYSNGTGAPGTSYELPGSGVNGAFLDTNPSGLIHRSGNTTQLGRQVFQVRNGVVTGLQPTAFFTSKWQEGSNTVTFDATASQPSSEISSYEWDFGDGTKGSGVTTSHTYSTNGPGRYTVTLKVSTGAGATDSLQTTITLDPVKAFAPRVYLHPDEMYFPDSASRYLDYAALRWDKPNHPVTSCKDEIMAASKGYGQKGKQAWDTGRLGGVTSVPYTHQYTQLYSVATNRGITYKCVDDPNKLVNTNDAPDYARKSTDNKAGWLLDLKGSDPYTNSLYYGDNSGDVGAPVYTEYEKNRYIIYWFFYPFNGWRGLDGTWYHEGDWENIVVKLDENDNATDVGYSGHGCSPDKLGWSEVELVQGTHPVVYSALGSHGSYAHADAFPPRPCLAGPDSVEAGGKAWDTWNNVVDARSQPWYGFGGAWGENRNLILGAYGPAGPSASRLNDPTIVPEGW